MVAGTLEWNDKFVKEYIEQCVLDEKGTPVFMKKVWGGPLPKDMVLLICRRQIHKKLPPYFLIEVPKIIQEILNNFPKENFDEWEAVYAAISTKRDIIKLYEKAPYAISEKEFRNMIEFNERLKHKILIE